MPKLNPPTPTGTEITFIYDARMPKGVKHLVIGQRLYLSPDHCHLELLALLVTAYSKTRPVSLSAVALIHFHGHSKSTHFQPFFYGPHLLADP